MLMRPRVIWCRNAICVSLCLFLSLPRTSVSFLPSNLDTWRLAEKTPNPSYRPTDRHLGAFALFRLPYAQKNRTTTDSTDNRQRDQRQFHWPDAHSSPMSVSAYSTASESLCLCLSLSVCLSVCLSFSPLFDPASRV